MKKKITVLILTGLMLLNLLCGCTGSSHLPAAEESENEELTYSEYTDKSSEAFTECAESGDLKLYFQPSSTQFYVVNSADDSTWYSSPQDAGEDETATKIIRLAMASSLQLCYVDTESQKETVLNSYTASVRAGDYRIEVSARGVRFTYHFDEIDAYIPLEIRLENGALSASVDTEKIGIGAGKIKIVSISVLPYFIAGNRTDSGYLFLADGSGALIHYDNGKSSAQSYCRRIYGEEPTNMTSEHYLNTDEQSVCLPVFGAVKNGSAVMAVGEDGAEIGTLNAQAAGKNSSYANAYISYILTNSVVHSVGNYTTELYSGNDPYLKNLTVKYFFLSGENADYSGMARRYRTYLQEKYQLTKTVDQNDFYLDVYAAAEKKISRLGVPARETISLATVAQTAEMTDWLTENGVDKTGVRYRNWNQQEISEKRVTKLNAVSKLEKGMSLTELNSANNVSLYAAVMDTQTYTGGNYISNARNACLSITGLTFTWYGYSFSTLNDTSEQYYRITLPKYYSVISKIAGSAEKQKLERLALGDVGNVLYCDYRDDGYGRTTAMLTAKDSLRCLSEKVEELALDRPNEYALPYADVIYNVPVTHSNQDILDESVPFYSMALCGIKECVAPAVNYSNVSGNMFLYAVASGCKLCYSWIYENESVLLGSSLSNLSNVSFTATRDEAARNCALAKQIADRVSGSAIYSHGYIDGELSRTVYENGTEIYVNFSDSEKTLGDGTAVPAGSFVIK